MSIQEKILGIIQAAHERDVLRGIEAHRNKLLNDLLLKKRYQERKGIICDEYGREADLEGDIERIIDTAPYIARGESRGPKRFVSKWEKPSEEQRIKLSLDVYKTLERLAQLHSIIPQDDSAFKKWLTVAADNFLYEFDEKGDLVFAKFNTNGLVGGKRFNFLSLVPDHLVDRPRTQMAQEIRKAELRDQARRLADNPKLKNTSERSDLTNAIERLQRAEIRDAIPLKRLPRIPRSEIEKESIRREAVARGFEPNIDKLPSQVRHELQNHAKFEYDNLDNTYDIEKAFKEIRPADHVYEGLSYSSREDLTTAQFGNPRRTTNYVSLTGQ